MTASPTPLRIGVMVNGPTVRGWEYDILERIAGDARYRIAAVVENDSGPAAKRRRLRRDWRRTPWNLANRVEAAVSARRFDRRWPVGARRPDAIEQISRLGLDAKHLAVRPRTSTSGLVHEFTPDDVDAIRALELDVILRFGFNILRGEILCAARYGIWSFHHGDNRVNRGSPAGFWEVANATLTTGTVLQVLSQDLDNGMPLRTATYMTVRSSWNENRRRAYAKSTSMMIDALGELAQTRVLPVARRSGSAFELFDGPLFRAPDPARVLATIAGVGWRRVADVVRFRRSLYRWHLLVARGPLHGQSFRRFQMLSPPPGLYWADPFIVTRDGQTRIFYECFDLAAGRGHIRSGALNGTSFEDQRVAFAPDYHLSYPFMLEFAGELYCIPESAQARTIELWRCHSFPDDWRKQRNLMSDLSAVDTTIFEHDGRWWMLTNIDRIGFGDHNDELHLFSTDDPVAGEWVAHPQNPVVADAAVARMGGAIIRLDDQRLVRPAQRTGEFYGSALLLMEIEELTETCYRESLVEQLQPFWIDNAVGLHHCHSTPQLSVFDVCLRESNTRGLTPGPEDVR